jgi:hypothetical protein
MANKILTYKLTCDFCGERCQFKNLRQVPLRIDKNSKNQNLFGFICNTCEIGNKKLTADGQKIKSFVGKTKAKNEASIFDEEDSDE